jgi:hypothetical protein
MKVLAAQLNDILKDIEQSRVVWNEKTKKFILDELRVAISDISLDWVIDVNDSIRNHETVTLRFHNVPSGLSYNEQNIFNEQEGKSGNLTKYGGTLNFSHVYLGDVMVWMTYPYIPEILENTENFVDVMRLKQDRVEARVIREAVTKFLSEIISWHLGKVGQEQRIGFKTSEDEQ